MFYRVQGFALVEIKIKFYSFLKIIYFIRKMRPLTNMNYRSIGDEFRQQWRNATSTKR